MAVWDWLKGSLSLHEFARAIVSAIHVREPNADVHYDHLASLIVYGDVPWPFSELRQAYQDYLDGPRNRRTECIEGTATIIIEEGQDWSLDEIRAQLRPTLVMRSAFENGGANRAIATRPLVGSFATRLVVHRERYAKSVTSEKLRDWGLDFETALTIAVENLREADASTHFIADEAGFYVSNYHDLYDTSRVLMPEVFEPLNLVGQAVAIIISRRCLCVAGSGDLRALEAMGRYADAIIASEPASLGYEPIILRDGGWGSLAEGPGQPSIFKLLRAKQRLWDYRAQAEILAADYEDRNIDAYVSEVEPFGKPEDPGIWTTWTNGIHTLLAQADAVVMGDPAGESMVRWWKDVAEVCSLTKPEPDLFPPRYILQGGPTDAQWARLRDEFPTPAWFLT